MQNKEREPLKNDNVIRGMLLEARDGQNWYSAKVLDHNKDLEKVLIHFQGWNSKYDEWLPLSSSRIRQALGKELNKSQIKDLEVGDNVITRWSSKFDYTPGKVLRINPDGKDGYAEVGFVDRTKKILRTYAIKPLDVKFDLKGYLESLSEYLPTSVFDPSTGKGGDTGEEQDATTLEAGVKVDDGDELPEVESVASASAALPFTDLTMIQEFHELSKIQNSRSGSLGKKHPSKRYAPLDFTTPSTTVMDQTFEESVDSKDLPFKRPPRIRTKSKRLSSPPSRTKYGSPGSGGLKTTTKDLGSGSKRKSSIGDAFYDNDEAGSFLSLAPNDQPEAFAKSYVRPEYLYTVPGIHLYEHHFLIGKPDQSRYDSLNVTKASRCESKPFSSRDPGAGGQTGHHGTAIGGPKKRGPKRPKFGLGPIDGPPGLLEPLAMSSTKQGGGAGSKPALPLTSPSKPRISSYGRPRHFSMFEDDVTRYPCTQRGCTKDFRNARLLRSHLTHFHGQDGGDDHTCAGGSGSTLTGKTSDSVYANGAPPKEFYGPVSSDEEERIAYLSTSSSSYGDQEDEETKARRKLRRKRRRPKTSESHEDNLPLASLLSSDQTPPSDTARGEVPDSGRVRDDGDSDYDATLDNAIGISCKKGTATTRKGPLKGTKAKHPQISGTGGNGAAKSRRAGLTISTKSFFTKRRRGEDARLAKAVLAGTLISDVGSEAEPPHDASVRGGETEFLGEPVDALGTILANTSRDTNEVSGDTHEAKKEGATINDKDQLSELSKMVPSPITDGPSAPEDVPGEKMALDTTPKPIILTQTAPIQAQRTVPPHKSPGTRLSTSQRKKSFGLSKKRASRPVWADRTPKSLPATTTATATTVELGATEAPETAGQSVQPGQVLKPQAGLPESPEEGIIHCICGANQENGLMLQCDSCLCWLHCLCVGYSTEESIPDKFVCPFCLEPRDASKNRLSRYLNMEWSDKAHLATLTTTQDAPVQSLANDQAIYRSSVRLRRRLTGIGTGLRSLRARINGSITEIDLQKFNEPLHDLIAQLGYEEKPLTSAPPVPTMQQSIPDLSGPFSPLKIDAGEEGVPAQSSTAVVPAPTPTVANGPLTVVIGHPGSVGETEPGPIESRDSDADHNPLELGDGQPVPTEGSVQTDRGTGDRAQGILTEIAGNEVGEEAKEILIKPEFVPANDASFVGHVVPDVAPTPVHIQRPVDVVELLESDQNMVEQQLDTLEKELEELESNPYFMFDNPLDSGDMASAYAWRNFDGPSSYSFDQFAHYSSPYTAPPGGTSGSSTLLNRDLFVTRTQLNKVLGQFENLIHVGKDKETGLGQVGPPGTAKEPSSSATTTKMGKGPAAEMKLSAQ